MIGDALVVGGRARLFVVGDDRGDLGVEPADADLVEQVQQRVVELADHHDDALLAALVDQRRAHAEALDGGPQRALDGVAVGAVGRA